MARIIPPLVFERVEEAFSSAGSDTSPFWQSDSEGTPEEGMHQLAPELDVGNAGQLLARLPPRHRMVHAIFLWETGRGRKGTHEACPMRPNDRLAPLQAPVRWRPGSESAILRSCH